MKSLVAAGLLAALAIVPVTSAQADVIYTFTQTTPTVRSPFAEAGAPSVLPVVTSFQLIVTDEAARDGFTALITNPRATGVVPQLGGVVGLALNVFNVPSRPSTISYDLADFVTPTGFGSDATRYLLDVTAAAGGLLSGRVRVDTFNENTWLTFNGTSVVSGQFAADSTNACSASPTSGPGCTFSGVQTLATTVPEPMSLALFGVGLAGLGIVTRRRKS